VFKYVNKLPHKVYVILEAMIDISLTFVIMNIVDVFFASINIPIQTEILFSILSYLFSQCIDFLDKENSHI
ncbi:MAG: YrvL family regulatory protein, partial [Peptostreptococcaceae bacterium]